MLTEPPQPTEDCPHQFGYFKIGDAKNCSGFRNCVNGVAYDFTCPDGLAFSSESYRCEWPDESKDCDAEGQLHELHSKKLKIKKLVDSNINENLLYYILVGILFYNFI